MEYNCDYITLFSSTSVIFSSSLDMNGNIHEKKLVH